MGKDTWMEEYKALERSGDAIMENITQRNRTNKNGGDALKLSAKIRQSQNNFTYDYNSLKRDLESAHKANSVSQKEFERRRNLLNEQDIRRIQIQKAFEDNGQGPSGSAFGITNMGYEQEDYETEVTQAFSNSDLQQQQQTHLKVQDKGLERISAIVKRQKEIGLTIGNELDEQNEIIEDITHKTETVGDRVNRQTKGIGMVAAKEGSVCGYYFVIVLLFAAIVCVIILKFTT